MNDCDIYKFGPHGDVSIHLSPSTIVECNSLPWENELVLQLVVHAIIQMREDSNTKKNNFIDNNIWHLKCTEDNNYYAWEYDEKKKISVKIPKTACFTFAIFDLCYEGNPVFTMQEGLDGYEIQHVDFARLDEFLDSFLEAALKHAERFGRL